MEPERDSGYNISTAKLFFKFSRQLISNSYCQTGDENEGITKTGYKIRA
jgi:hypothetical protein